MKVLAIETATAVCAAAIVDGTHVLAEQTLHEKHVHSEKLLMLIETVRHQAGEYDVIAVSIGPGSFTGLRIGLSVAKGMAYGDDKRIVAVPTLEGLAWRGVLEGAATEADTIVAMIDARRNDVYAGVFSVRANVPESCGDAAALSMDEVMQRLDGTGRVVLMGDAAEKFGQRYSGTITGKDDIVVPPLPQRLCSAASVGILGTRKAGRGEFSELASLEPMYVKDFVSLVRTQHVSPQQGESWQPGSDARKRA